LGDLPTEIGNLIWNLIKKENVILRKAKEKRKRRRKNPSPLSFYAPTPLQDAIP